MKYVGFCYDSGAWGRDLTGLLLVEDGDGWAHAGSHISSSSAWSEQDIKRHFDRRPEPSDADTFEWAGLLTVDEARSRFPASSRPDPEVPR